jgi:hypothetical protein
MLLVRLFPVCFLLKEREKDKFEFKESQHLVRSIFKNLNNLSILIFKSEHNQVLKIMKTNQNNEPIFEAHE